MMQHLCTLQPIPPYNFQLTLDILSRHRHPTTDVNHDGYYWRVLQTSDDLHLLRIESTGNLENPTLDAYIAKSTSNLLPTDIHQITEQVRHILAVNDSDTSTFYRYAQTKQNLWEVIKPLVGLRWLRTPTIFEALMMTIIEQQITWTTAQKAQRSLVEWANNKVEYDGMDFYAFPTSIQLAHATIEDLKPLKITFKRMQAMIDIAKQTIDNELDLESISNLSIEKAYRFLVTIKGIGHWTAIWTLQRSKGNHNYVGYNDVALQAAVNHYFYGAEGRIPEETVKQTFREFGEYAGMAANHTLMRWVIDRYPPSGIPQT